jgi:hypothetical protein
MKMQGQRPGPLQYSKKALAGFWGNSDFEFSQEIDTQTGSCHCGLQKLELKRLLWNWMAYMMKPQEGMSKPFAPLEMGTRWLIVGFFSHNAQCCSSVNQVLIIGTGGHLFRYL